MEQHSSMLNSIGFAIVLFCLLHIAEAGDCYYRITNTYRRFVSASCTDIAFDQMRTDVPRDEFIDYNSLEEIKMAINGASHKSKDIYKVTSLRMIFTDSFMLSNGSLSPDQSDNAWQSQFQLIHNLAVYSKRDDIKNYVLSNLEYFPNVVKLHLHGFQLDDRDMDDLCKLPALETLMLTSPESENNLQNIRKRRREEEETFVCRKRVNSESNKERLETFQFSFVDSSEVQIILETDHHELLKKRAYQIIRLVSKLKQRFQEQSTGRSATKWSFLRRFLTSCRVFKFRSQYPANSSSKPDESSLENHRFAIFWSAIRFGGSMATKINKFWKNGRGSISNSRECAPNNSPYSLKIRHWLAYWVVWRTHLSTSQVKIAFLGGLRRLRSGSAAFSVPSDARMPSSSDLHRSSSTLCPTVFDNSLPVASTVSSKRQKTATMEIDKESLSDAIPSSSLTSSQPLVSEDIIVPTKWDTMRVRFQALRKECLSHNKPVNDPCSSAEDTMSHDLATDESSARASGALPSFWYANSNIHSKEPASTSLSSNSASNELESHNAAFSKKTDYSRDSNAVAFPEISSTDNADASSGLNQSRISTSHSIIFAICGLAILIFVIFVKLAIVFKSGSEEEFRLQRSELIRQIDLFANARRQREGLPPLFTDLGDFSSMPHVSFR